MPRPKTTKASHAQPRVPKEAAASLAAVEHELAALPCPALFPVDPDIPRAVAVVVGALPHLRDLRSRLLAELPHHSIHTTDTLGTYALAAWYAHLLALPTVKGERALLALFAEARPRGEELLAVAEALTDNKLLDPEKVAEILRGQESLDKTHDLVTLAALFTQSFRHVHGKTAAGLDDIERAAELGPLLLVALSAREQRGAGAPGPTDLAERRARAYALFVKACEEARRAVSGLRRYQEVVHETRPSPVARRRSARKSKAAETKALPGAPALEEP
jgi:hypothetical protein